MTIYDGGSDDDNEIDNFNGNDIPPTRTSTKNQIFISFTSNSNGLGKGFSASFTFGK